MADYPLAKCPYVLKSGGCEIYQDRPIICRLFGLVIEHLPNIPHIHQVRLKCPRGITPKVNLSKQLLRDIFVGATDIMNREACDVLNVGARPYPAGPYGPWIWQDIKRRQQEAANGASG
jgi:Fe-S-cluster containining protein